MEVIKPNQQDINKEGNKEGSRDCIVESKWESICMSFLFWDIISLLQLDGVTNQLSSSYFTCLIEVLKRLSSIYIFFSVFLSTILYDFFPLI